MRLGDVASSRERELRQCCEELAIRESTKSRANQVLWLTRKRNQSLVVGSLTILWNYEKASWADKVGALCSMRADIAMTPDSFSMARKGLEQNSLTYVRRMEVQV